MNKVLHNYLFTILLLAGILLGGILGVALGPDVMVVKPIGELFLNLLFVLVVPLVFFSTASSVSRLTKSGKVGKVLGTLLLVFLGMSLVAALISYVAVLLVNPLAGVDTSSMVGASGGTMAQGGNFAEGLVGALTVSDFPLLFSKSNLLALIVFAALFGAGTALVERKPSQEGAFRMSALLDSGTAVVMKVLDIVMYIAPLGLGCYFACMVAEVGAQLIGGYVRAFVEYIVIALVIYFIINSLYVFMARGASGVKSYWRHILPPTLTSLATASSAAALPSNIEAAKRMGVSDEIADTVVALGTNIHKDGSVVAGVLKVTFALMLTGHDIATMGSAVQIIGIAVLAALVTGAIASGGMTGEMLICAMLGLDPQLVGVMIIVGTIVDTPSTVINATSNTSAAVVVDRIVNSKPLNNKHL